MKSKIFIPAVLLAAVVMFSGCGNVKKNEQVNMTNMKLIMTGVLMYACDNNDCYSNELNDLVAGGYMTDTMVYVSPSDKRAVKAAPGSKLTSKNTSYAYFGKGINMKFPLADVPVLIVKPWSLAKGEKMLVG